ncbi:MAG: fused DSP-PTPase phosphatase/NAD kinase-like protein [Solirubrobacterales bacterium]
MSTTGMRLRRWLIVAGAACVVAFGVVMPGCGHTAVFPLGLNNNTRQTESVAASSWAQPVDRPGLPNLYRVSDDLYRGAQPAAEGIPQLKALGVKTVVNLRDGDTDHNLLDGSGLEYKLIPMTAWQVHDDDVVQFLRTVTDKSRLPAFVHCRRGADRTGMMVAVYRVAVQGWDKEQAIAEMTQGGFRFNSGWQNLVQYVRDLDVNAIKRQAGLASAALN